MITIGIFEAKTKFSEICEDVAASRQPVTVTRHGKPLVRIEPIIAAPMTIRERREAYLAAHGAGERRDSEDFSPPVRSREITSFDLEGRA